jgi:hypothetical protein
MGNSTPAELGEALAAFIPASEEREAFLRACNRESAPPPPASAPAQTPAPTTVIGREVPSVFDPALVERAGRALAHHIGPFARVLLARALQRATTEAELLEALAAEIPRPAERATFLAALRSPPRR